MPRGGRRPGAGAKPGNTNALKTGRFSRRVKIIVDSLMHDPEARDVLLRLGASGRARDLYARQLAIAMARLLHDHPITEAKRRFLDGLGQAVADRNTANQINRNIATFEQTTGVDAFTATPLARPARRTPAQTARLQLLQRRMEQARLHRDDQIFFTTPEPHNMPFTDPIDRRPTRFGVKGPLTPAEYEAALAEWERDQDTQS